MLLRKRERRRIARFKPANEDKFTAEEEREFKAIERLMKKRQRRGAALGILTGGLLLAMGIGAGKAHKKYIKK